MYNELERFLDSLISQYGIGKVILAPSVLIGTLAGAGIISGGAVSFVATISGLFIAVVVISALSLQLRAAHVLLAERAAIMSLYAGRFTESAQQYAYTIEDWEEKAFVTGSGKTMLERWVTILAADQGLNSAWSGIYRAGMEATEALSSSGRRRIRFEARSFDENMELGARYDITSKWQDDWLWLFIHFDKPVHPGQIVRIWVRWEWPEYYKGLLIGQPEPVHWIAQRPAKRIAATITFDKDCNLRNGIRVTPYPGSRMPKQIRTPGGQTVISVEYTNVIPQSQMGFRLDTISITKRDTTF
jgi:hypothetical protein